MQTHDTIIIGKAPDYVMKGATIEYYHHVSITMHLNDAVIRQNSISNRSLCQLIKELQQIIMPMGWHRGFQFEWSLGESVSGEIKTEAIKILFRYPFVDHLNRAQRKRLRDAFIDLFNSFCGIANKQD